MASIFNGQSTTLKYLFTAFFEDGHTIEQTPEDVSTIEPEKRSAFFDVLAYEQKSPLIEFALYNLEERKAISVDLKTGLFTSVLGDQRIEFNIADQLFEKEAPFRLIYFRENRVEQLVGNNTGEIKNQRFYINRYFIGWQTTWNNENYQRTIAIDGT